jgi:hypothetical protein
MINLFRKSTGAKLSLVLLSIFLFLLLFAPAVSAAMMGDIDDSGSINVLDVVLAKQHVLGLQLLTPAQKLVADVNGSGDVDVLDVDLIMRKTLGLISEFPFVQLQVSSVTAVNARQVEVVFNAAVTKSLAENPANYEIYKQGALFTNVFGTAANGAVSALQADGRTVLLTLNYNQALVSGSTFNRIVVKAAVGLTADYTNSSIAFFDTTAPTFQSVSAVSANAIALTFSEPVRTISGANLTGVQLSDGINPAIGLNLAAATFSDAKRTVNISLTAGNLVPGRTYTVSLLPTHNLEDYAFNKAFPATRQFIHTPVTSTPSVTAAAINEKTIRLTFDRPVSFYISPPAPITDNVKFRLNFNVPTAIHRASNDMNGFGKDFDAAVVAGSGNTQYDVQFASPLAIGSHTLYIHYETNTDAAGRIADGWGNVLPNNTAANFNVAASTTPVIVSAYTVDVNSVAIVYSQDVSNNGFEPAQYTWVYPGVGTWPGLEIISDSGNTIVVRFFAGTLNSGQAYPDRHITYEQSTISSRRTKLVGTTTDVLSPDMIVGVSSGF